MPDTATPNLALTKPEVGGSSETWGNKWNGNADLIDSAVAARLAKAGGAMTGAITDMGAASTVKDGTGTSRPVGFRNIPSNMQTAAYVLAQSDAGRMVQITSGGVTVPSNATVPILVDDAVTIYNNSGASQTITQATGVTLRLAGTGTTGNRTLAQRGLCTVVKIGADEWVASGSGLT